MMVRKGLIRSIPLLVLIAALAVVGWVMVPAGTGIPLHWSASGEVNRTGAISKPSSPSPVWPRCSR